jgi:hypothetical protein
MHHLQKVDPGRLVSEEVLYVSLSECYDLTSASLLTICSALPDFGLVMTVQDRIFSAWLSLPYS